jgi:hypothetical protein
MAWPSLAACSLTAPSLLFLLSALCSALSISVGAAVGAGQSQRAAVEIKIGSGAPRARLPPLQ